MYNYIWSENGKTIYILCFNFLDGIIHLLMTIYIFWPKMLLFLQELLPFTCFGLTELQVASSNNYCALSCKLYLIHTCTWTGIYNVFLNFHISQFFGYSTLRSIWLWSKIVKRRYFSDEKRQPYFIQLDIKMY